MPDQNLTWWQKYWKQALLGVLVIFILVAAVLGWHWEETAYRPFWYNSWPIVAGACIVVWISAWAYLWNKNKKK